MGGILHAIVGSMDWDSLSAPLNLLVLAAYLIALVVLYAHRKRFAFVRWAMTYQAAVPSLVSVVFLTFLMGITRQVPASATAENLTVLNKMLSFWPFILLYFWMTTLIGLVSIKHLCAFRLREVPFLCNHLGLFIALTAGALGSADMQQLTMHVRLGQSEWRAIDADGKFHALPLTIELKDFTIDTYPPEQLGAEALPRRFASEVVIIAKNGEHLETVVEVNHPAKVDGWKIYQYSYGESADRQSVVSIFGLVADPWLPIVYIGIALMLVGAACWIVRKQPIAILLFAVCICLVKLEFRDKALMPALQSPWFAPHVTLYMFAYTLLGAATLTALYLLWRPKTRITVCDHLVYAGVSFMTLGMLTGALWAKEAWGHYWAWDPKETWAAITWFSYLIYIHARIGFPSKRRAALFLLLLSFALLQMCWWGINYLPAAQENSVHTYDIT